MDTANRQMGTVKSFDDATGFGFITNEFGGDLMVRRSSLPTDTLLALKEGMKVSYEPVGHGPFSLVADQIMLAK
ncbi:hypothetical protein BJX99DRAFT_230812 [Aspergillus californicus]